jgi:hypothetical protein
VPQWCNRGATWEAEWPCSTAAALISRAIAGRPTGMLAWPGPGLRHASGTVNAAECTVRVCAFRGLPLVAPAGLESRPAQRTHSVLADMECTPSSLHPGPISGPGAPRFTPHPLLTSNRRTPHPRPAPGLGTARPQLHAAPLLQHRRSPPPWSPPGRAPNTCLHPGSAQHCAQCLHGEPWRSGPARAAPTPFPHPSL